MPDAPGPRSEPDKHWTLGLSQEGKVQPVIGDDVLVTGTRKLETHDEIPDNAVVGYDARTGTERWRVERRSPQGLTGPPAVADGTAYYAADRALGPVGAVDLDDGTERWRLTDRERDASGPVQVVDGTAYVVLGDRLTAIDATTGDIEWQADAVARLGGRNEPFAVGPERVYCWFANGDLVAFDRAGGGRRWAVSGEYYARQSVVAGPERVYVTDRSPPSLGLAAYDGVEGTEMWRFETGREDPLRCALADGVVYLSTDQGVYALDAASGDRQWSAGAGGVVAVGSDTVFVGGRPVTALDRADGSIRWTAGASIERPLVVGNVLITVGHAVSAWTVSGDPTDGG